MHAHTYTHTLHTHTHTHTNTNTPHTQIQTHTYTHSDSSEPELTRAEQHRGLSRALAADKAQLGDVLRSQKRAMLAAQLAESRAVEEALAVAPEQLRLGLVCVVRVVWRTLHLIW
jgi:hypothetical protein